MVSARRCPMVCCAALLAFWPAAGSLAQQDAIRAEVDRPLVRENESFTYTLRVEGRLPARAIDLSALSQDFDVLRQGSSTSFQIVNGQTSRIAEWVVTLMPRRTGTFELPAIEIDGVLSNTVTVQVIAANAADDIASDIFMEAELDRSSAYEQSQIVYTLRLFIGVGTGPATLTEPLIGGGEAIVEKLGSDREYQTIRGDRVYNVRERSYAIFPQQPGRLRIGPAVYEAMVQPSRGLARRQRISSDVLELEVRPAVPPPPEYPDAVWLPARSLTIDESWSAGRAQFEQGVPQTRTLTVVADGLLDTQLPELNVAASRALRQYPDQPELAREVTADGIVAERTERFAVIAQQAGPIELPPVELPWWNVDRERWELARIEARAIDVRPGVGPEAAPADPVTNVPREVVPVEPDAAWWPWLSAALALGWLATIAAWIVSSGRTARQARPAARPARLQSSRQLLKQLSAACRVDDARRSRDLLLAWAARQFPDDPPTSLGELAGRLNGPVAAEIVLLEAALYGPQPSAWRGQKLAELLQRTRSVGRGSSPEGEDPLVPLYR